MGLKEITQPIRLSSSYGPTDVHSSSIRRMPYSSILYGSDGKESACNVEDPGLIPGLGRFPGEGTATHSNIPAWRIPWTEEPGVLQSMGLQRVRHD